MVHKAVSTNKAEAYAMMYDQQLMQTYCHYYWYNQYAVPDAVPPP